LNDDAHRRASRVDQRPEAYRQTYRRRHFARMALDAFDFFFLVFVFSDIAHEFGTKITDVSFVILWPAILAVTER
jgi:hypothetical protein